VRPRVYVETTIPSYLAARPSRHLIPAARQQSTRDWWDRRHEYELFVSELVLAECSEGDTTAAESRLRYLTDIPILSATPDAAALAADMLGRGRLPKRAADDAAHMAIAAVHATDYLLTWNCRHMANPVLLRSLEDVCRVAGFRLPVICTPDQLLGADDES
jgi:predicted nucleic acid-binding protein